MIFAKTHFLYEGKEQFLFIGLKVFCKTPNESVIESIGRFAVLHTKPPRNCNFKKFETELMLDWNGPNITKSRAFVEKSLVRHFGSGNGVSNQDLQSFLLARLWTEL